MEKTIRIILMIAMASYYGCGGGGGGGGGEIPPSPPPVDNACWLDNTYKLGWTQEPFYDDNTYLDVARDIKLYEIYISDRPWIDNVNQLAAYVSGTHQHDGLPEHVVDHFDLCLLNDHGIYADNGGKYVIMRTVCYDGGISEYSEPYQWGSILMSLEVIQ